MDDIYPARYVTAFWEARSVYDFLCLYFVPLWLSVETRKANHSEIAPDFSFYFVCIVYVDFLSRQPTNDCCWWEDIHDKVTELDPNLLPLDWEHILIYRLYRETAIDGKN